MLTCRKMAAHHRFVRTVLYCTTRHVRRVFLLTLSSASSFIGRTRMLLCTGGMDGGLICFVMTSNRNIFTLHQDGKWNEIQLRAPRRLG